MKDAAGQREGGEAVQKQLKKIVRDKSCEKEMERKEKGMNMEVRYRRGGREWDVSTRSGSESRVETKTNRPHKLKLNTYASLTDNLQISV